MAQELIEGEAAEKAKREKRSEKKKAKKKKKKGAAAEPAAPAAAPPPSDDEDADEDGDAQEPSAPAPSDSVGAPPLAGRCGSLGPDLNAPAGGTRAACTGKNLGATRLSSAARCARLLACLRASHFTRRCRPLRWVPSAGSTEPSQNMFSRPARAPGRAPGDSRRRAGGCGR